MRQLKKGTFIVLLLFCAFVSAQNPYKAPLYWNPYEYNFTADNYIPESEWSANIDWMDQNLKQYGYKMICIDGWGDDNSYTVNGYRTKHSSTWTHDYAWWSANLQSRGMTLGIYNNPLWVIQNAANAGCLVKGTSIPLSSLINTSENALWFKWVQVDRPGAEEYVKGYIQYYADMGVKYLRVDFLSWFEDGFDKNLGTVGPNRPRSYYETALRWMKEACDANGMFLSLVMPHLKYEAQFENVYGHMYRINEDCGTGQWYRFSDFDRGIRHSWWSQYYNTFDGFVYWSRYSGRGNVILDGDFIRLNTFANDNEKKSVISLNLIAGGPVSVSDRYNSIGSNLWLYQNTELLALNADTFVGKPFNNDPTNVGSQYWKGQMSNGDWIVGLFNRESTTQTRSINFSTDLGISGSANVRDLWQHLDLGSMTSYSVSVPAHGCVVLKIVAGGIPTVATPTFNPPAGTYGTAQNVTISCATSGATIRYTTDGTNPTASSPIYSTPINVTTTTTLKAYATKSGMTDSPINTAVYTISALPSPWLRADVGTVNPAGTATYAGGLLTNQGAGADIEGTSDAFSFVYVPVTGNVTITAKVVSLSNTNAWAKGGVMIRESLAANSKEALTAVTPTSGATFQRRTSTGGSTTGTIVSGIAAPYWVRLTRASNTITAYRSSNGTSWTKIGSSVTITMASQVYVGLAVTSHSDGTLCSGVFSNVTVTGSVNYTLSQKIDNDQTSIANFEKHDQLSIFPNPGNDQVMLRSSSPIDKVLIYNVMGELVSNKTILNEDQTINVSNLQNGLYILKAFSGENIFTNSKLVIKH